MDNIKTIGVMTSGGDSPGMNTAIRAVVRACAYHKIQCKAIYEGYRGLINNQIDTIGARDVRNIINDGGTILKTARSEEFKTKEGRKKAYANLIKNSIDALVIIGGDGSMTGAMVFHQEFGYPTIGIPGTIDNDIYGTDFTIGYDTALNTAVEAIDKIRDTATSHNRIFFVEVMGRDSGFIALHSGIAGGAQDILVPEQKDSLEELFNSLNRAKESGKKSNIVVVAEGEELGNVYELAKATKGKHPEYDIRVVVLGHIQRGGNPSCADRVLASRLGVAAVEALLEGRKNEMVGIKSNELAYTPFEVAVKRRNQINKELLRIANITSI